MWVVAKDKDGPQWAREGDGRLLRIGAFMRKRNTDELPQFWNVPRKTGICLRAIFVRSRGLRFGLGGSQRLARQHRP